VSMSRILIKARGAVRPLIKRGDPRQRAQNRRVEVTVKN
jgi:outer membrane protein OmpA-like peptidoglycan-associated protein